VSIFRPVHCCQIVTDLSGQSSRKIQKNSVTVQMLRKTTFQTPFYTQFKNHFTFIMYFLFISTLKIRRNPNVYMVSPLNYSKNIFKSPFCHFMPSFEILRLPIFYSHGTFFRASFAFFGRKFGHVATVVQSIPVY
jgi:hypothetical protein